MEEATILQELAGIPFEPFTLVPPIMQGSCLQLVPLSFLLDIFLPAVLLLLALGIDRLVGDPPSRLHPVCMMGALARMVEARLRHGSNNAPMFWRGALACMLVVVPCALLAWCISYLAQSIGGDYLAFVVTACILVICLAPQSLAEHARRVAAPLMNNDIDAARYALSMIVGRQVDQLDSHGIARACVESVGENLVDGVLSTLFWAGVGLCLFGYPEAAALAVLHRSSNVLDAQWGKKNDRYIRFGTFAARLDDCLNYLPTRLSLPSIALAATTLPKLNGGESLRIGWKYRKAHESPNSAWSEAAFAGALGLRLGGPAIYAGALVDHPWIGDFNNSTLTTPPISTPDATPQHIRQAIRLVWRTTLLWCLGFGLFYAVLVLLIHNLA